GRGIELARASGKTSAVAQGLSTLANARRQAGDLDGALTAINESSAIAEKAYYEGPTQRATVMYAIEYRRGMILGEDDSVSLARPAEAEASLRKAFDISENMAAQDAKDFSFRDKVGTSGQALGDIVRRRDPAAALQVYDQTLARLREIKTGTSARRR